MASPRYGWFGLVVSLLVTATVISSLAGCSTGRVWGKGAAVGAVAGASTALPITLAVRPDDGDEQTGIVIGTTVGAAVLGALVGHYVFDKKIEPEVATLPPPPPPPAPPPLAVLTGASFAFNSFQLTAAAKEELQDTIESLRANQSLRIRIDGHTDSVGPDAFNQALSQRRADAVKAYMVSEGIAADRIQTRGLGESSPVADNSTDAGRAQNRRVEVHEAP